MAQLLTIRAHSGLSGDILLCGLASLLEIKNEELNELARKLCPECKDCLSIDRHFVHQIGGWKLNLCLPQQHEHRSLHDIIEIFEKSSLSPEGKDRSHACFNLLAEAEAKVHGLALDQVHFHEVGALDSILDIGLVCELFSRLAPDCLQVSPLPFGDGSIQCRHGLLCSPAPAVLELLQGVSLVPFAGQGETVTPTAIALLKSLGASFGPWPAMTVEKTRLVYGSRVFEGCANGAIFVLGRS